MDEEIIATIFATSGMAAAANKAHIFLCGKLAIKGIITPEDIEVMHHEHLDLFDQQFAEMPCFPKMREALNDAREKLDEEWHALLKELRSH